MSEILRTGMQLAPYIGVISGAVGGAIAEHKVQKQIIEDRAQPAEILGEANTKAIKYDSRLTRNAKKLIGPLALAGAFVGGVAGYALPPEKELPAPDARVQLVVDRSGATAFGGESDTTPAGNINQVLASFDEQDNFKVTARVAVYDGVQTATVEEAIKILPEGDAPMGQAFGDATEGLGLGFSGEDVSEESSNDNPAITVLTNGNSIGSAEGAIRKAREADSPVYVINVADDIEDQAEESLQKIADETRGQYWDIDETSIEEVPDMVSSEVSPAPEQSGSGLKIPERVFALFGLAMWGVLYRYRGNQSLTFSGSNIDEGEK